MLHSRYRMEKDFDRWNELKSRSTTVSFFPYITSEKSGGRILASMSATNKTALAHLTNDQF